MKWAIKIDFWKGIVFKYENLFYLFPLAIFLPMIFTNILTILMLVMIIKESSFSRWSFILRQDYVLLFLFFYALIFLGFFYDIPINGITNDLEKKLSFVIIPIAMVFIKPDYLARRKILMVFFYAGFVAASICFLFAIKDYLSVNDTSTFVNHGFSMHINLHATYLSMYLLFSLSYPIFYYRSVTELRIRRILLFMSAVTFFYIILLSSRIVWLLTFITLVVLLVHLVWKFPYLRKKVLLVAITITGLSLILFFTKPLNQRLLESFNYNNNYNIEKVWGGRGVRFLIWDSCIDLLKSKPLFGYGSSKMVQNELNKLYIEKDYGPLLYMMNKLGKVFNPHNQYLEEILKFGVIIGMYFLFILLLSSWVFLKNKNFLGLFLVFILFGVSITETILELNKGIVFFSFFLPLVWKDLSKSQTNVLNN
ncbi:O-antigen ligase family protein [Mangrovimonas xylaniphaga]|uniref:O-antigen ligase family protein n=1 Tax=Mangrovimonas xylaniphaga TaxID=1645915 RepID=UPI0006B42184|nr:O-antigen ligase family protein [Mangrovimonas xylaniphaga]